MSAGWEPEGLGGRAEGARAFREGERRQSGWRGFRWDWHGIEEGEGGRQGPEGRGPDGELGLSRIQGTGRDAGCRTATEDHGTTTTFHDTAKGGGHRPCPHRKAEDVGSVQAPWHSRHRLGALDSAGTGSEEGQEK